MTTEPLTEAELREARTRPPDYKARAEQLEAELATVKAERDRLKQKQGHGIAREDNAWKQKDYWRERTHRAEAELTRLRGERERIEQSRCSATWLMTDKTTRLRCVKDVGHEAVFENSLHEGPNGQTWTTVSTISASSSAPSTPGEQKGDA